MVSIKRAEAAEAKSSVPTRVRYSMEHHLSSAGYRPRRRVARPLRAATGHRDDQLARAHSRAADQVRASWPVSTRRRPVPAAVLSC